MSRRKSIKQKPRFDFIPEDKWKKLSKDESSLLRKYRSHYRWTKDWSEQIDQKKSEIDQLNKKIDRKLFEMNKLNDDIDHLRDTYDLTISFVKQNSYKNKKGKVSNYWSVCVTFRGQEKKTRLFPLGSEDKIKEHMLSYFKSNPFFKKSYDKFKTRLTKKFKEFMVEECKMGEIYEVCFDKCLENPKGFREGGDNTKLTLSDFYPISTK